MATTLEYDIKVQSIGLQYGEEAAEKFTQALRGTQNAGENLEESLAKQEARIKVLDGAINVLGGSVELAVGSISALGLVSEEQAEQFQSAALGAIAFADGAKRTFDGIKSLTEGLKAYGGIAGAARKIQLALNASILANPYVLAAAALAALVAGIIIFTQEEDAAAKALELSKKAYEDETAAIQLNNASRKQNIELLQAQGAEQEVILKQQIIDAKQAKEDATNLRIKLQALNRFSEETTKARADEAEAIRQVELAEARLATFQRNAAEKAAADAKTNAEKRKTQAEKEAQDRFNVLNAENVRREKEIEDHLANVERLEKESNDRRIADRIAIQQYYDDLDREAFENDVANLRKRKAEGDDAVRTAQEQAQALSDARNALLGNTAAAVGALANLFGEGTKAFKAAALAEIAISTASGFINALDIAQKSAKATGPAAAFAFPIFYASQIAAVLGAVASAKQVLATTPGGAGGTPTASKPSGGGASGGTPSFPSLGGGFQGLPAGTAPIGPAAGQEPIRAYVVSNDVTNGVQAQGQLRRRRRLGPG